MRERERAKNSVQVQRRKLPNDKHLMVKNLDNALACAKEKEES